MSSFWFYSHPNERLNNGINKIGIDRPSPFASHMEATAIEVIALKGSASTPKSGAF